MFNWFKNWFKKLPKNPQRKELKLVSYSDAGTYLSKGWTIAPEEHCNHKFMMVYLELLEDTCNA